MKDLATRLLNYRDKEKNGLVGNLDELSRVPGINQNVLSALKQELGLGTFNLRSVEVVGPRAGQELRQQAVLATLCALGGMLIYVAFRFKLISGGAAVLATLHDIVITLGLFSLTGREIDLTVIAALLTLIGYSMNDKIVVLDRVRENLRAHRRGSFLQLVNQSINQTLSRTILTAGLTLLACLALCFLGGKVLNGIAFALCAGIVVGIDNLGILVTNPLRLFRGADLADLSLGDNGSGRRVSRPRLGVDRHRNQNRRRKQNFQCRVFHSVPPELL